MSSGLEAPPVTVSTQQQRHTAKSLWRFEPWSRAPSVTCAQSRRVRRVPSSDEEPAPPRRRASVASVAWRSREAPRNSICALCHLGNLPGVPLAHGVVVAHARDAVAELKSAGHRDAWLGARPSEYN